MTRPPRSRSPGFVVRDHHPLRLFLLGVFVGAALATGALLVVGLQGDYLRLPTLVEREDTDVTALLERRIAELGARNDAQAAELALLRRQRQVERQAEESAATHLRSLQDQASALRQEVAFYRGIVAGSPGRGFEVQSFSASKAAEPRAHRFRVVLTNDSKDAKVRQGFVSFSVDGEQDGNPVRLSFLELTGRGDPGFEFRFRVYQKLEGKLTLPEGFLPRVVNVEVSGADGAVSGVKRSFDWPGNLG